MEPLNLGVGLGSVAAGSPEADAEGSGGLGEDHRLGIGLGVVGQDPLDPHAMVGEEGGCLDQEPGRGGAGLIGQDLAEGDPGTVIDGRMDIVVADASTPNPLARPWTRCPPPSGMRPSFLTSRWTSSPGRSR